MIRRTLAGFISIGIAACMTTVAAAGTETVLIQSDFTGLAPGVNTPWVQTSILDPNLTFSGWDFGPGANGVDAGINDAMGFDVVAPGTETTLAEAVANGSYLTCTIDPAVPIDLNGVKVEFQVQRYSWHAARRYAILTSVGGFAPENVIYESVSLQSGDNSNHTFAAFLPETGYGKVAGPLEIRVYAYEATYGGHNTSFTGFGMIAGVQTYTLSLSAGPGGSSVAAPDRVLFEVGETVQLFAAPDVGSRFAGWSGDVTGFGNPRSIVMDADTTIAAQFEAVAAPHMTIGMNLGGIRDWASSWIFGDLFQRSRQWVSRAIDGSTGWDGGYGWAAPTDADGWPTQIPFDPGNGDPVQWIHTVVGLPNGAGDYVIAWSGDATGRFRSTSTNWVTITHGMQSIAFTALATDAMFLEVHSTQAPTNIRDISIVRQDNLPVPPMFEPAFTDRLGGLALLRFMDWSDTNASPVQAWNDRTRSTASTQSSPSGAAPEIMIQLANQLGQDAWFCIPHAADDNYVTMLAQMIRDTLDPALKAYIEYSNETWNTAGAFTQTAYVQDQGEALGLDPNRYQAGQLYAVLRTVEIMMIFDAQFGAADDRLVHVIGTQSANLNITNVRFAALNDPAINPSAIWPDALAIAPYFGRNYDPNSIPPNAPAYPTVDEIVDVIAPQEIADAAGQVALQKTAANAQGLDLICYEAGQHFVGVLGAENDDQLTQILQDANRDPRMYDRYTEYLNILRDEGVTMCGVFSFCGSWSKWGSWSVLERLEQTDAEAPKHRAIRDWMSSANCPADADGDGEVDFNDLLQLLAGWGPCPAPCPGDVDGNGQLDFADLVATLAAWGPCV